MLLGADHLIPGGGGAMLFLYDETFLFPSLHIQLCLDLIKSSHFFSAVYNSLQGVTTLTLTFHLYLCGICRTEVA